MSVAALASVAMVGFGSTAASAGTFPGLLNNNIVGAHNPLLIVNLYWDQNWDADNAGSLPPMASIDDFTNQMFRSGYLSALSQYGVTVGSPPVAPGPGAGDGFLGSFQADASCGTAPASVSYFDINGFVNCERHHFGIGGYNGLDPTTYTPNIIYMVYTPAGTTWGGSCPAWDGFHALTLGSIIPPDLPQYFGFVLSSCAGGGSMSGITRAASHEAVEAATDPVPTLGWIDNDAFSSISVDGLTNLLTAGEAADLCDPGTNTPVDQPPLNLPAPGTGSMLGGAQPYDVAYYWSNAAGACVLPEDNDLSVSTTDTTVNATSPAGANVSFTLPTVTDESGASFTCDHAPGDLFPIGTTTVNCTATADDGDDVLSPIGFSFSVTVLDTDGTLINVPAAIIVDSTSTAGAVVTYTPPTLVDEDSPLGAVTCNWPSGSTFPIGTTAVTCTGATDDVSGSPTATFSVTVNDTDLGITGIPADMTVNATMPTGAVVTWPLPTAIDEDTPLPVPVCSPASGSTFAIGSNTVTCTVSDPDDLNGPQSGSFTIYVKSAAEQLGDLAGYVNGLPPGNSLSAKVNNAVRDLGAGHMNATCASLSALVHEAMAQSGKHLTVAQANNIIAAAQRIENVLGC
jgi:hypothetical protein